MTIKFLGAAGEVTGSSYLVTGNSGEMALVDCGMFQGGTELEALNAAPMDVNPSLLTGVLLTHAHLDHCGRLPLLVKNGFNGHIWMTPPTGDLTILSLYDTAKIMQEEDTVLYDKEDVDKTISMFKFLEYDQQVKIGGFEAIYKDAGHILGSASIVITDGHTKIAFSGDLGNSPQDLIEPTEYPEKADFAVIESTYGDRIHKKEDINEKLLSEIKEIEKASGTLLIPAFSIERSQEILHRISHLKNTGKIAGQTEIFFDSPMGSEATQIFEKYHDYFNNELRGDFVKSNPFHFEGLTYIANRQQSGAIHSQTGPKVIIAGSGMMTGGRIVDHAINFLPLPTTRILFVGYQAEGTPGRKILEGAKTVHLRDIDIEIKAVVSEIEALSSHADQPKLLRWLSKIDGLKTVFLTHGEDSARKVFQTKITTDLHLADVRLPSLNQDIEVN